MIEHYVPSLSLLRGVRVRDYSSVKELDDAAGEAGACLRFANKYLTEKGALVDFRDKFAEVLEERSGFAMKVKDVTKKKADGTTETVQEADETEVQYLARFRRAVLDGSYSNPLFPKDTLEENLQSLADSLGAFQADAKRPERVAKPKAPAKWIMERVATIFQNGTESRWWDTMAKEGIALANRTGDKEKDMLALANAIKEREHRRELQEAKQYA